MRFWEKWFGKRVNHEPAPAYKSYTTMFDREVEISDLDSAIGKPSPEVAKALDERWDLYVNATQGWRDDVHWAALDESAQLRSKLSQGHFEDCQFTFLMDQSGSMRGQKLLLTLAAVDVAQDYLRQLGCAVEVLGFTTTRWRGGLSRKLWLAQGRPPQPGRLSDLLHIVYLSPSNAKTGTVSGALRNMLRTDLPKENIDGEALEWAFKRLTQRQYKHKYLVVLTDGEPADEATLRANGRYYLADHLRAVINTIEEASCVTLTAIGIGYDPSRFYRDSEIVHTPEALGRSVIVKLTKLLDKPSVH